MKRLKRLKTIKVGKWHIVLKTAKQWQQWRYNTWVGLDLCRIKLGYSRENPHMSKTYGFEITFLGMSFDLSWFYWRKNTS